jgi:hypothetical protein
VQTLIWIAAGFGLLVAGAAVASIIDRRAGWGNVPFGSDHTLDEDPDVAIPPRAAASPEGLASTRGDLFD